MLCVGHQAAQICETLGDGSRLGVHIDYSVEGETLLGTAGALRLAERFIQPHALVLNGDTYLAADYARILGHHLEERADSGVVATLTLARLEDTRRFGTVLLDPSERHLAGFREKVSGTGTGGAGWLNAGVYVIERELLERIPPGVPCSLEREILPGRTGRGTADRGIPELPTILRYRNSRGFSTVPRPLRGVGSGTTRHGSDRDARG